jgi:hypothetical protein
MMTQEEIVGPTPKGGVKSIAYFFNDKREAVDKEHATQVEIHELDKDGKSIFRTYGTIDRSKTEDGGNKQIMPKQLLEGHRQFEEREKRDAMYKVATRLVEQSWGTPLEVGEGLGVLLLVWNAAHFRHGPLDFDALEKCIAANQEVLNEFREQNILTYTSNDDAKIGSLFQDFLEALKISVSDKEKRTPVGVVKALHLLAPKFFPLWDKEIAKKYDCNYANDPLNKYLCFLGKIKDIAEELDNADEVKALVKDTKKTLIKLIDEYNYVTYTLPELARKAKRGKEINRQDEATVQTRKRYELFGYPVTAVLRWMGKEGWTKKEALKALAHFNVKCSPNTVTIQVRRGAKGGEGYPAPITPEQARQLNQAVGRAMKF